MGVNGDVGRNVGGDVSRAAVREPGAVREQDAVRIEIGELALHGFRVDPERVSAAFERELTRLVQEHGVPLAADGPLALDALSGLPPLPAGLSARRLGQELARVVHEGLSGRGEVTR